MKGSFTGRKREIDSAESDDSISPAATAGPFPPRTSPDTQKDNVDMPSRGGAWWRFGGFLEAGKSAWRGMKLRTRLAIAMVVLVLATTSAVGVVAYRNETLGLEQET